MLGVGAGSPSNSTSPTQPTEQWSRGRQYVPLPSRPADASGVRLEVPFGTAPGYYRGSRKWTREGPPVLWLWIVLAVVAVGLLAAWRSDRKERRLGHSFRSVGQVSREAMRYREVYSDPKLPNSLPEARSGHQLDQER